MSFVRLGLACSDLRCLSLPSLALLFASPYMGLIFSCRALPRLASLLQLVAWLLTYCRLTWLVLFLS